MIDVSRVTSEDEIDAVVSMVGRLCDAGNINLAVPADAQSIYSSVRSMCYSLNTMVLAARLGDKMAGVVGVSLSPAWFNGNKHVAQIAFIYVDKDYRGKGVGLCLMESALAWAREKKSDGIYVAEQCRGENTAGFYSKFDFEPLEVNFFRRLS